MIALFGLPGLELLAYRRVSSRRDGIAWLDARLAELGESQQSLQARRQSRVVSEREARGLRWQSGARIISAETMAEEQQREVAS